MYTATIVFQKQNLGLFVMMDNSLKVDAEDLYQISLLIDQMRHDDVHLRINATKCIGKIGEKFVIL